MAHYAILDDNNIVTNVFVGKDEGSAEWWELYYSTRFGKQCKRTSYNTIGGIHKNGGVPFRKNFASIGFTYDKTRDAFIPPKIFNSWILNESSCTWQSPIPKPDDNKFYYWDENNQQWLSKEQ
jgi:hypothetical protein